MEQAQKEIDELEVISPQESIAILEKDDKVEPKETDKEAEELAAKELAAAQEHQRTKSI